MSSEGAGNRFEKASTFVKALIAIGALIVAITEVRALRAMQRHDKMEALYGHWSSPAMLSYRATANEQHLKDSAQVLEVMSFFERLARARQNGIITDDDVQYYFEDALVQYWCSWEPWVRDYRVRQGQNPNTGDLWYGFEREATRIMTQYGGACPHATHLALFVENEKARYAEMYVREPREPETEKSPGRS